MVGIYFEQKLRQTSTSCQTSCEFWMTFGIRRSIVAVVDRCQGGGTWPVHINLQGLHSQCLWRGQGWHKCPGWIKYWLYRVLGGIYVKEHIENIEQLQFKGPSLCRHWLSLLGRYWIFALIGGLVLKLQPLPQFHLHLTSHQHAQEPCIEH